MRSAIMAVSISGGVFEEVLGATDHLEVVRALLWPDPRAALDKAAVVAPRLVGELALEDFAQRIRFHRRARRRMPRRSRLGLSQRRDGGPWAAVGPATAAATISSLRPLIHG